MNKDELALMVVATLDAAREGSTPEARLKFLLLDAKYREWVEARMGLRAPIVKTAKELGLSGPAFRATLEYARMINDPKLKLLAPKPGDAPDKGQRSRMAPGPGPGAGSGDDPFDDEFAFWEGDGEGGEEVAAAAAAMAPSKE